MAALRDELRLERLEARAVAWLADARTPGEIAWRLATWLLLGYAALQAAHAYAAGFDGPLLDRHSFRQTQTAISAYWIAHGGPLVAYETPVFGAPYPAPFEFPLYQWIVALLSKVSRLTFDEVGRSVSIGFFVLTALPFHRFLTRSGVSAASARLALAVLFAAPEYLFWTRTFLIESTALFLAVALLAEGADLLEKPAIDRRLAWLSLVVTLALLVKVTTALGYLVALGIVVVVRVARDRERRAHARGYAALFAAAFVVPAIPLLAWTRFADYEKGLNPLAHFIQSAALHDWNYGTMAQKTAASTWQTFWDRTMDEAFGSPLGFVACAALALFGSRGVETVLALLVGTVATYAVFTNLHIVHDYYQCSTVAGLVAVVGLGFGAAERMMPRARALLLAMAAWMVNQGVTTYEEKYLPGQAHVDAALLHTGEFIRSHTAPEALVAVFGDDWSSVVPYYAQRHALMDRDNRGPDSPVIRDALKRSAAAGNVVEAVVTCNGDRARSSDHAEKIFDRPPRCTSFPTCDVCL